MIIKFNPSLEIKSIYKAIFSKISLGKSWGNFNNISFYSRGTWALYNGIIQALELKGKKNGSVWFPDYFCNEALIPLRKKGIKLKFYPINKNLEPEWMCIENKLKNNYSVDIFVLVHYFGFVFSNEKANKICQKFDMILIEDGAHVLKKKNLSENNFSIYSPRKILPIPEIGVLVSKKSMNKNNYSQFNLNFFIWFFKSITENILCKLNFNWYLYNLNTNNKKNSKGYHFSNHQLPCLFSLRLLNLYENNINAYGKKRIENYKKVENSIDGIANIKPLFNKFPSENIPYVFPLIVKKNYSVIKNELLKLGIVTTSWKDMPPEIEGSTNLHEYATYLSRSLLLIPIHQSIGDTEINFMIDSIIKINNIFK